MKVRDVAGSFDFSRGFNTLVLQPSYRISLRLGTIEDLFEDPPDTWRGRAARLQILGLFYYPLQHPHAPTAFETCWAWVKERIFKIRSDAEADAILQQALKDRVVGPAYAPFEANDSGGGLPPSARDPKKPTRANFAKIRLPGGYSFNDCNEIDPLHEKLPSGAECQDTDPSHQQLLSAYRFSFGEGETYPTEDVFYRDNCVLGKIPVIATVEKKVGESWQPAAGVAVYFQLQTPYLPPEYDPETHASKQFGRPPASEGVERYLWEEESNAFSWLNPQETNCPESRGGKRRPGVQRDGSVVAGVLFATDRVPGFHGPHKGPRALPEAPYLVAERAPQGNPDAVRTTTNRDGDAGVVFLPSRMGGDRYRFRVYVGSPTLKSYGDDPAAVRVETGTLVVWRNVRISRFLTQECRRPIDARILADAREDGMDSEDSFLGRVRFLGPDDTFLGPPELDFSLLARKLALAFCEVEYDGEGSGPDPISDSEYSEAYRAGVQSFRKALISFGSSSDEDSLLLPEELALRGNSGMHFPMRSFRSWREKHEKTLQSLQDEKARIRSALQDFAYTGFLQSLARNGFLPGFTVVHGAQGNNWALMGALDAIPGQAYPCRALLVWFGRAYYATPGNGYAFYDFTSTVLHELGHCLFRLHAFHKTPTPEQIAKLGPYYSEERHDPLDGSRPRCGMSYDWGPGEFCSRCLLALRGWDISKIPILPPLGLGANAISREDYHRLRSQAPTYSYSAAHSSQLRADFGKPSASNRLLSNLKAKTCTACGRTRKQVEEWMKVNGQGGPSAFQPDHMVAAIKICSMPGFAALAAEQPDTAREILTWQKNLLPLCRTCNGSKGQKSYEEWDSPVAGRLDWPKTKATLVKMESQRADQIQKMILEALRGRPMGVSNPRPQKWARAGMP